MGKFPHEADAMNQFWIHPAVLAMNLITWAGMIAATTGPSTGQQRSRW